MMRVLGSELTLQAPFEAADRGGRHAMGSLCSGSGARSRDGEGDCPPSLGAAVQVQFPNHLHGQKITLQNLDFSIEFGGIVIVEAEGAGVLEIQCRSGLLMAIVPLAS